MGSKRQCRPGVESMADRIVLSHVNPAVSLAHIDTAHVHIATLTFKGTYFITPAGIGPTPSSRYISFGTPVPTTIKGLGLVEMGGSVNTLGPGTALPVHPSSFNIMAVNNYAFNQGVNAPNPGLFRMEYGKKVAPVTNGFSFAYTFTISSARGEFAGAHGGGKVEVKLVPKPPLSANAPAQTQYTGKCTVRFHFSPSSVLT
jgi:hypothetical protein